MCLRAMPVPSVSTEPTTAADSWVKSCEINLVHLTTSSSKHLHQTPSSRSYLPCVHEPSSEESYLEKFLNLRMTHQFRSSHEVIGFGMRLKVNSEQYSKTLLVFLTPLQQGTREKNMKKTPSGELSCSFNLANTRDTCESYKPNYPDIVELGHNMKVPHPGSIIASPHQQAYVLQLSSQ